MSRSVYRDAVPVCCVDPAGWRNGDQVVAEVHERVDAVPGVEPVRFCQNAGTDVAARCRPHPLHDFGCLHINNLHA